MTCVLFTSTGMTSAVESNIVSITGPIITNAEIYPFIRYGDGVRAYWSRSALIRTTGEAGRITVSMSYGSGAIIWVNNNFVLLLMFRIT